MTHWLTQISLDRSTHVPADRIVNTLHWDVTVTDELTQSESLASILETFYSTISPVLSDLVSPDDGNTIKFFDMSDPEPRVPFRDREFVITDDFGTGRLPAECCICISFHGDPVSGANMKRRRGRIFIGPISPDAVNVEGGDVRVDLTERTLLAESFEEMVGAAALVGAELCVFSRADSALYGVVGGWVDNAVDIQRRRGSTATARTTFGAG